MIGILAICSLALTTVDDHSLDFWLGDWTVTSQGQKQGNDKVEKWLNGEAIVEHWKDEHGADGKSFFYYTPAQHQWKQVWVEKDCYKEKLSEPWPDGIRFTGTVFLPTGKVYGDRTTLTRLKDGGVHQVIQATRDGVKWKTTFDAEYHHPSQEGRLKPTSG